MLRDQLWIVWTVNRQCWRGGRRWCVRLRLGLLLNTPARLSRGILHSAKPPGDREHRTIFIKEYPGLWEREKRERGRRRERGRGRGRGRGREQSPHPASNLGLQSTKPGQAASLVPRRRGFEAGWGDCSLPSLQWPLSVDPFWKLCKSHSISTMQRKLANINTWTNSFPNNPFVRCPYSSWTYWIASFLK